MPPGLRNHLANLTELFVLLSFCKFFSSCHARHADTAHEKLALGAHKTTSGEAQWRAVHEPKKRLQKLTGPTQVDGFEGCVSCFL
ncbi:hypothetical protein LMG28690_01248 [Paraburkholderia caffeinilytica]|nr:hypothetical protein LMG28690_01248 [Paraburkholderia caffeinilytica]